MSSRSKNLIILAVFSLAFAGIFEMSKNSGGIQFQIAAKAIPSVKMFGYSPEIGKNFFKYGAAIGIAMGMLAFALSALVVGILKFFSVTPVVANRISNVVAYGGIVGLGAELVFLEDKSSALAAAIICFTGKPLLFSGLIVFGLTIFFLVKPLMKKDDVEVIAKKALLLLLVISPLFLSGCSMLGNLTQVGCSVSGNGKTAAHCYQEAAVQKNNERVCDKAPQGEEFKSVGSNPPQDKCYYMVAENKRDPNVCDNIKGGLMSYVASECKTNVVDAAEKEISEKLKKADNGKSMSAEELQKIQQQMEEYNKTLELMSNATKTMHDMNMTIVKSSRN